MVCDYYDIRHSSYNKIEQCWYLVIVVVEHEASKYSLRSASSEVVWIISHAVQERLKALLKKLATIVEHRRHPYNIDARYLVDRDVKGQLQFLAMLDNSAKSFEEKMVIFGRAFLPFRFLT